ncbi:YceD family protein [Parasporobacterium paucivorans]|uniref:DUF177 domain-containing protein n=1 Tax=Parasporobacterium paucivorans DSM 15970 TaxID=1122934 RepID=A0A1M6F4Y3_9FIRM|nr:DUF177 domain-containing protein [Parasporobacterium paucivorans]SHI92755.1 uncharacterized protein SAMN02745691_01051 [Parasporobacterium paucivorans DSM 15970]
MLIDLSRVLSENARIEELTVEIETDHIDTGHSSYRINHKSPFVLKLTNIGIRKILMEVQADISLAIPCDRCLEEVITKFQVNISKEIDLSETEPDPLDEKDFIVGESLDLDRLIHEEILADVPMKVLCKPDCLGICKKCGANRNFTDCGCDSAALDPRMSKILDVFNEYKEV